MSDTTEYEVTISFTYYADSFRDAAKQFVSQLQNGTLFFVNVRNLNTHEEKTIDLE